VRIFAENNRTECIHCGKQKTPLIFVASCIVEVEHKIPL